MPYYLYEISDSGPSQLVRKLELLGHFEQFRDAKNSAKQLRVEREGEAVRFKVIFAENPLHAEELLMEKREKPVLMEFER